MKEKKEKILEKIVHAKEDKGAMQTNTILLIK